MATKEERAASPASTDMFDTHPPLEERIALPPRAVTVSPRGPCFASATARPRRPVRLLALLAAACCGGGDDDGRGHDHDAPGRRPRRRAPPTAPLTGLPVTDAAAVARPALIVKIDNVEPKARPQAGLNQADVVYEERVEGSVTRLLAIFHSTDAGPVGPVRSARTSDIGDRVRRSTGRSSRGAGPTTPSRSASAPPTLDRRRRRPGHGRSTRAASGRPAPSNLMLAVDGVDPEPPAGGRRRPPPPLFTYRAAGQAPGPPRAGRRRSASATARAPARAPVEYRGTAGLGPHPEGHPARRRRRRAGRAGQRHHPVRRTTRRRT